MYELGYCLLLLLLYERKLTIFPKDNIRYEHNLFSRSRQVLILSYWLNIDRDGYMVLSVLILSIYE